MAASESELLSLATSGDNGALTTLLQACGTRIRRQLVGSIGKQWQSALDIDDVMQVTYLEVFVRIRLFKANGLDSFEAWLRQIAENNLRDAIKELGRDKRPQPQNRAQLVDRESSCVCLFECLSGTTSTPSRGAVRQEICRILKTTLDQLPSDYQRVVRLYDLEGKPIGEVAAALGRSEGAVYMLRARSHDRLRELLGPASKFFSDSD